jgi:hypothetical protein
MRRQRRTFIRDLLCQCSFPCFVNLAFYKRGHKNYDIFSAILFQNLAILLLNNIDFA